MKTKYMLTLALIVSATALFAQPHVPATPIDGGLSILLAAGGIYGIKKLRDSKKD